MKMLPDQLSKIIGYKFKDTSLLLRAMTHKSKRGQPNNERLEFLGDAVLSLVTAQFLYNQKNLYKEGELSQLRANFVCQAHLSKKALDLNLQKFIISDGSMRRSGSNSSPSVLSDALEAIIGAVYIDGGLDSAKDVIFNLLGEPSLNIPEVSKDAKTELQEFVQSLGLPTPEYELIDSRGPSHSPNFEMAIKIDGKIVATSKGESKKIAAQKAAMKALEILHETSQRN